MKIFWIKLSASSVLLFLAESTQALQPEVLYAFERGPSKPHGSLVQAPDGLFYGTSTAGGDHDAGTVFKVSTNGVLTTLVSFTGVNGASPLAGLALALDGSFYGTTYYSGGSGCGTVFRATTNGALTTLVSFTGANGAY